MLGASTSPQKFNLRCVFKVVVLKFSTFNLNVVIGHRILILTCLFGFIFSYYMLLLFDGSLW